MFCWVFPLTSGSFSMLRTAWQRPCLQSHYDDAARFCQPILSLRLFSDSRLSFGTQLYGCVPPCMVALLSVDCPPSSNSYLALPGADILMASAACHCLVVASWVSAPLLDAVASMPSPLVCFPILILHQAPLPVRAASRYHHCWSPPTIPPGLLLQ